MEIEVRAYEITDIAEILTLSSDHWKENHLRVNWAMMRSIKAHDSIIQCLVAVYEHKIVGYIFGYALPDGILLPQFLYVHEDYRHQGIGRMLLENLEARSGCSISRIFYNTELHNFYERQGYESPNTLKAAAKILRYTEGDKP